MMTEHWFWWLVTMSCILWYATITVYVAFKGMTDIRNMVRRLKERGDRESTSGE